MNLQEMSTKSLLALHNAIADAPAGPKTFATKVKLIARIEQIAADKDIDLASSGRPKKPKVAASRPEVAVKAMRALRLRRMCGMKGLLGIVADPSKRM